MFMEWPLLAEFKEPISYFSTRRFIKENKCIN
jgi:hypothetical protein